LTDVKVCGLTREEDVHAACALGAAYVGFNFSALSLRRVRPARARSLAAAATGVLRVGVFVEESFRDIEEAAAEVPLDLVQIHRPLVADDLRHGGVRVLAVVRAGQEGQIPSPDLLGQCAGILFDSSSGAGGGGSGVPFDWSLLEGRSWPVPLFVAGGLHPANVAGSIRRMRPAAVDVASGVEASPGVKDHAKMERFFAAVREADARAG
jgi:phosphoribosylanthranilate isomerase